MIPRLFVDGPLTAGAPVDLSNDQAHYVRDVLRRQAGAPLLVFNGRDGEFAARLEAVSKKSARIVLEERTRPQTASPDLVLAFAPVKRQAVDAIIQKGTELGAAGFAPVFTARTNAERVRGDRLTAIAREAAEQCGRLTVPNIAEPVKLDAFLNARPTERPLIFCDEAGDDPDAEWGGSAGRAAPLLSVLPSSSDNSPSATILIGPEGGFSPDERARLRAAPGVAPVTLGPRILRADTAALAALTIWQAVCGDLRER